MENPSRFIHKTVCCFTGHRPPFLPDGGNENAPGMILLRGRLFRTVEEAARNGVSDFYAGGALGFDLLAAETVLELQAFAPVRLHLALPSRTQAARYAPELRQRYQTALMYAEDVWYASEDENSAAALLCRDRYMVEHADCCIAYLTQPRGGTAYTVRYAEKRGLPVVNLAENPN